VRRRAVRSQTLGLSQQSVRELSDRAGASLPVAVPAANTNDAYALKPLVMAIPAIKSRRPTEDMPTRPMTRPTSVPSAPSVLYLSRCRW
jgi:hypothetical protein